MRRRARIGAIAAVVLLAGLVASGQIQTFRPVTEAMLVTPDQADWPNFCRRKPTATSSHFF